MTSRFIPTEDGEFIRVDDVAKIVPWKGPDGGSVIIDKDDVCHPSDLSPVDLVRSLDAPIPAAPGFERVHAAVGENGFLTVAASAAVIGWRDARPIFPVPLLAFAQELSASHPLSATVAPNGSVFSDSGEKFPAVTDWLVALEQAADAAGETPIAPAPEPKHQPAHIH